MIARGFYSCNDKSTKTYTKEYRLCTQNLLSPAVEKGCCTNHFNNHFATFPVDLVSPTFHPCVDVSNCVHTDPLDVRLCCLANNLYIGEEHKRWLCELLIRMSSASLPELFLEYKTLEKLRAEYEDNHRLHFSVETTRELSVAQDILDARFHVVIAERQTCNTLVALCDSCTDDDGLCWSCADRNKDTKFVNMDTLDMYAALHTKRKAQMKYALRTRSPLCLEKDISKVEGGTDDNIQHIELLTSDVITSQPKKKARIDNSRAWNTSGAETYQPVEVATLEQNSPLLQQALQDASSGMDAPSNSSTPRAQTVVSYHFVKSQRRHNARKLRRRDCVLFGRLPSIPEGDENLGDEVSDDPPSVQPRETTTQVVHISPKSLSSHHSLSDAMLDGMGNGTNTATTTQRTSAPTTVTGAQSKKRAREFDRC